MSDRVILTADDTLMSDYRRNEFLGFGTCAPSNFIPDFLYQWLFFPHIKTRKGLPVAAPYGLRKIEAQLQNESFNVMTVAPNHLGKYINGAGVLGIHVMDPFGLGPASSTLASILKKEPFLAQRFRALMSSKEVREAKKRGLRIVIGGPGSWQFRYRRGFVEKYGIDCVVEGEAEKVTGGIFRSAINGEALPRFYEAGIKDTPRLDEIPDIAGPSINGLVEIGRGCCRGCQFCSVTVRPLRWCPYDKIAREMNANANNGRIAWTVLHAEDVMLYGSKNTLPDDEKLIKLHEMVVKKSGGISWSHCSLAAVASKPRLFSRVAEIIHEKNSWWGAEIGIETGSSELAKKMMPAKAHPFKPEEWPDIVCTGMGMMHDQGLVPAGTLIVGTPEETEDDLTRTIEMLDKLKNMRSLIVPLFFVPMGRLKDENWFKDTEMTELHKQLLTKCLEHDLYWIDDLIKSAFAGNWYARFFRPFYGIFTKIAKYKVKKAGINAQWR